jgi:OmpA-OmpF porin, OOP family
MYFVRHFSSSFLIRGVYSFMMEVWRGKNKETLFNVSERGKTMFMGPRLLRLTVVTATLLFLAGCAASKLKITPISTSENPSEQVDLLAKSLDNARKGQVNVLSPTLFSKAEESLKNARKELKLGNSLSHILREVSYGKAQLQRAEEMAQVSRSALPDVLEARDRAIKAGAPDLGKDYETVEQKFLALTRAIEGNDLDWARENRLKVTNGFDRLELQAIKHKALGEARKLVIKAEAGGASEIAPKTLAEAQRKLSESDDFITKNRYEKDRIQLKAAEALFQAKRLEQVMLLAQKIRTAKPEDIALLFEGMLQEVADKLSSPDLRDQPMNKRLEGILDSINALQGERQSLAETDQAQQKQIALLEGLSREEKITKERLTREERAAKERLEAEKRFRALYSEIRNLFGITEAEIYKQGNRLVIRLRAVKFPVGKAIIMPGNYELLSRVQMAIRKVKNPEVVIEGHTDSTGSDAVNQKLSQDRAEAVRQYLIANETVPPDKILAVGYGSSRPLASNATEEGRAINRRIDVLITPET